MRSKIEGNSLTSKTCQALKVFRTSANHQIASHLSSRQDFSMVCNGLHLPAFSPNSLLYRKSWVWASHKPLWEKFQKVQLDGHPIQTILQLNSVSESQKRIQAQRFRIKSRIGAKMIKQSIWPQTLGAAELIPVCRGLLKKLRASAALGRRKCAQKSVGPP